MEDNFQIASASITDRGLSDKRPQNEDSFLELSQYGIFAVADGVGGAQAGDVASQMAMEILGEAFSNKPEGSDAEVVMRAAIESANSAIFQMSHDLTQLSTMATTIVALHLEGNIATIGHVGDSRVYRIDSSGLISQETNDHSVVAEEVRAGRMTPEQAAVHPSRNVISRALGAEPTVDVDLKTMMVEPGTTFILCSDGITRHINDWELENILNSDDELADVCQKLKQICFDRGAEDNLTAVVVKIKRDVAAPIEQIAPVNVHEEIEEETITTARSPFDTVAEPIIRIDEPSIVVEEPILDVAAEPAYEKPGNGDILELEPEVLHESSASGLVAPEVERPISADVFELPEAETEPEPADIASSDSAIFEPAMVEPAVVEPMPQSDVPVVPAITPAIETTHHYVETTEQSRSFFGRFLSALLLLAVGALVGIAGMYFFFQPRTAEQNSTSPTPLPIVKATPSFSSFEDLRRRIDEDPNAYLEANKAYESDADAADLYLRGRALMRLGLDREARQAFVEAKKRLKATDSDAATLNTEISLALAVLADDPANVAFKKDLADWAKQAPANTGSNTNLNNSSSGSTNSNTANGAMNANR